MVNRRRTTFSLNVLEGFLYIIKVVIPEYIASWKRHCETGYDCRYMIFSGAQKLASCCAWVVNTCMFCGHYRYEIICTYDFMRPC